MLSFTVTVYNKGKRSKDTEVAELTVELSSLTNGDEVSFKSDHLLMEYIKLDRNDAITLHCSINPVFAHVLAKSLNDHVTVFHLYLFHSYHWMVHQFVLSCR